MSDRILTEEGQRMWDNLAAMEKVAAGISILPPVAITRPKKIRFNPYRLELNFIRLELRKMIKNSEMVIQDCELILKACKDKEAYFSNDAKVAITIHSNMILRVRNILNGMPAFEEDIELTDDEINESKEVELVDDLG